jgi:hypothetical protein
VDELATLGIVLTEIFLFQISIVLVTCVVGYAFALRLKKKTEVEKGG